VDKKKIPIYIILLVLFIALLSTVYSCGHSNGNTSSNNEYANRLSSLEDINRSLQAENKYLTDLNSNITKRLNIVQGQLESVLDRLGTAKEILGELDFTVSTDSDTIERLTKNLRILEQAIEEIFANDKNR
jgi:chromosome segregation ATPase